MLGIRSRIGFVYIRSNRNIIAAYNGVFEFELIDVNSARDATKKKRVPFTFFVGLVGSDGWWLGSSGVPSVAELIGSVGLLSLYPKFGMLLDVVRSGRMEDCLESLCVHVVC